MDHGALSGGHVVPTGGGEWGGIAGTRPDNFADEPEGLKAEEDLLRRVVLTQGGRGKKRDNIEEQIIKVGSNAYGKKSNRILKQLLASTLR